MTATRAIVTGHSRGLGAAVAEQLLSREVTVLAISRKRAPSLAKSFPRTLQEVQLDLADVAALTHWLDKPVLKGFLADAKTAVLVNNAGLLQPVGPLITQDPATVGQAVSVNLAAALMLSAALAQVAEPGADRRILHVSSAAGSKAYRGWAIYCATKAALDHHARCVKLDDVPNLRISSVAPGLIDTEMQTEIRASSIENFPDRKRFEEFKERGELRQPRDVAARLVDYLLSASFGSQPVIDLHAEVPRP
ncbi:MAG: SDR family oxidoreductase [Gemmatimonadaceae bacterium]